MRVYSSTRLAAIAVMVGALACARNTERDTDVDETAAAPQDTVSDTLGGEVQNPPGYRGMERDTALAPPAEQTPTDTFLQQQGQGTPQDTAGYTGAERVDTTGQAADQGAWEDTTAAGQDTSGAWGADTAGAAGADTLGAWGADTAGMETDTTGYNPTQEQSEDTTSRY
ncbi:MAG: hypothetical protein ACREMZ_13955 [Gemmatimonadales bacterium]